MKFVEYSVRAEIIIVLMQLETAFSTSQANNSVMKFWITAYAQSSQEKHILLMRKKRNAMNI